MHAVVCAKLTSSSHFRDFCDSPCESDTASLEIPVSFHSFAVVLFAAAVVLLHVALSTVLIDVALSTTVNTASRMESNSVANRILYSERSYMLLRDQAPTFFTKCRGRIDVKGKGSMLVWWVGDNRINARKGLKTKSVEFDFTRTSIYHQSLMGMDTSDEEEADERDEGGDGKNEDKEENGEEGKDQEFMDQLDKTIDTAAEELRQGKEVFIQDGTITNYQEQLAKQ